MITSSIFNSRLGLADRFHDPLDTFQETLDVELGLSRTEIRKETVFLREIIDGDLEYRLDQDLAARSKDFIVNGGDTSFHAIRMYRIAHALWSPVYIHRDEIQEKNMRQLALRISNVVKSRYAIEIHPGSQIGRFFNMDHGTRTRIGKATIGEKCTILDDVVIGTQEPPLLILVGESSFVGEKCTFERGVVLGAYFPRHKLPAKLVEKEEREGRRHPKLGNNVTVCRCTRILGCVDIGDNVTISPHCIVTSDIPSNSRVLVVNQLQIERNSSYSSIVIEGIIQRDMFGIEISGVFPGMSLTNTTSAVVFRETSQHVPGIDVYVQDAKHLEDNTITISLTLSFNGQCVPSPLSKEDVGLSLSINGSHVIMYNIAFLPRMIEKIAL